MREKNLRLAHNHAALFGIFSVILSLGLASEARATVITFGSDTTWDTYDANPVSGTANLLGPAQYVADNASSPSNQPPGTVIYGYPAAGGMTANLASIPGAHWIWAPGITGATLAPDFQQFYFT